MKDYQFCLCYKVIAYQKALSVAEKTRKGRFSKREEEAQVP